MKASTIVAQTTYTILYVAEQFRVYRVAAGTSFGKACKEVFASESFVECNDYIKAASI